MQTTKQSTDGHEVQASKNPGFQQGSIVKYARNLQPGDEAIRFRVVSCNERNVSIELLNSGMFIAPVETVALLEVVCVS